MANTSNSVDELVDQFLAEHGDYVAYAKLAGTPQHPLPIRKPAYNQYKKSHAKLKAAINKTILEDVLEIIGEDLPMDQPFDDDMDPVELVGNRLFRKGANWAKDELRQQLTKRYGGAE